MSFFVTGVALFSAATTAYGAVASSNATKAQGKEAVRQGNLAQTEAFIDAEFRGLEADQIEAQAVAEATLIKRQALTMRAGLAAAQSGSGVVIGEGSAQAAMDQIDTLASADVLAALYSGSDRAVATRTAGRMTGEAGRSAAKTGALTGASLGAAAQSQLVGGLLSAAASGARAFTPTPAPKTAGLTTKG